MKAKHREFVKHDHGKVKLHLVPKILAHAAARVFEFGIEKYEKDNWRKGADWSRYRDAVQRHLDDWWEGKDVDEESGMHPLWHIACDIAILLEHVERGLGNDDRYRYETKHKSARSRRRAKR